MVLPVTDLTAGVLPAHIRACECGRGHSHLDCAERSNWTHRLKPYPIKDVFECMKCCQSFALVPDMFRYDLDDGIMLQGVENVVAAVISRIRNTALSRGAIDREWEDISHRQMAEFERGMRPPQTFIGFTEFLCRLYLRQMGDEPTPERVETGRERYAVVTGMLNARPGRLAVAQLGASLPPLGEMVTTVSHNEADFKVDPFNPKTYEPGQWMEEGN